MTESEQFAIIPAPVGDGFVELAAAPPRAQGKVFRKQILKFGDLKYKGRTYKVDDAFADTLVRNFHEVGEIVHAPKAGARNEHNDDPDRNVGEVIGVEKTDKGVDIILDARTSDAEKIGKTILGVSGLIALNHENRETGERVGPTLLHACLTNRPHVTGLAPFEEILAMTAGEADIQEEAVFLTAADETEESTAMPTTKEELIEALKNEHKIDVVALTAEVEELRPLKDEVSNLRPKADGFAALTSAITDTFTADEGVLALSATDATVEEYVTSITNAHDQIVALSTEIETQKKEASDKEAEADVEKLVLSGYILPAKKEAALRLRKHDKDLFEETYDTQVISLSHEQGGDPIEIPGTTYAEEIERLSKLAPSAAS